MSSTACVGRVLQEVGYEPHSAAGDPAAGARIGPVPASIGILATARNLPRLTRIARILARHGLFAAVRGKAHSPAPHHVRDGHPEVPRGGELAPTVSQ
jgi:hypothetical protein